MFGPTDVGIKVGIDVGGGLGDRVGIAVGDALGSAIKCSRLPCVLLILNIKLNTMTFFHFNAKILVIKFASK